MTETILRPLIIHADDRGSVREAYRESWFPDTPIKQIVHSESKQGVLRGMHAHARQTDIWHFTSGEAQVQTYNHVTGEWQNVVVDGEYTIVIPPGVSHGFLALTDLTLTYYLTEEYDPTAPDEHEWNALDRKWHGSKAWKIGRIHKWLPLFGLSAGGYNAPISEADLIRSQRDLEAPSLAEFRAAW